MVQLAIILILYLLSTGKITSFDDLLKGKSIALEFILLIAIVGLIPGLFIKIAQKSAVYFMDMNKWLSLVYLASLCITSGNIAFSSVSMFLKNSFSYHTNTKIITLVFIIPFILDSFFITIKQYEHTLRANNDFKKNLLKSELNEESLKWRGAKKALDIYSNVIEFSLLDKALEKYPFSSIMQNLNALDKLPIEEKKHTLIYVPRTNTTYWEHYNCYKTPFLVPSITGIAQIHGIPEADSCKKLNLHRGYSSYFAYDKKTIKPLPSLSSPCKALENPNFKQIIFLNNDNLEIADSMEKCVNLIENQDILFHEN